MNETNRSSLTILKRRSLLKAAAVSALASTLAGPLKALADDKATGQAESGGPTEPKALPYVDRIGLQLYTLRNQMAEDPETTLRAVAQAGYQQVELMRIDEDAIRLAAMARDNGLAVHSAFMNWKAITSPGSPGGPGVEETIELAERIGLRHIVFGYIAKDARDTLDKIRKIASNANEAGEKTRDAGMRLCYHNHSFEFKKLDGKRAAFDEFIKRFDPQKVEFELDVFWAKLGGRDPIHLMRHLAARISQVHLKNLKADVPVIYDEGQVPHDAFQEVGDGVIDMPAIMRLAKRIGVDQCHVEQDQSPAPLESIVQSIDFLKKQSA